MKSSSDPAAATDALAPLPATLTSMWRLCKLGFRHEPRLMVYSLVASQLASLPSALTAVWLALLGSGIVQQQTPLVLGAAAGMAVARRRIGS